MVVKLQASEVSHPQQLRSEINVHQDLLEAIAHVRYIEVTYG